MRRIPTLALATTDDAGQPHTANVNFVADDDLNLYFLSAPDSAHSLHVAKRPRIAACGYPSFRLPKNIKGFQLKGLCEQRPAEHWNTHWKLFCRKFPYAIPFKKLARREEFYRISPDWLRLIDNSVKFGFKMESDWPPPKC